MQLIEKNSIVQTSCTNYWLNFHQPREQVAANPKPTTSSPATFAREHAAFTAAQIASQMSVEDCWYGK